MKKKTTKTKDKKNKVINIKTKKPIKPTTNKPLKRKTTKNKTKTTVKDSSKNSKNKRTDNKGRILGKSDKTSGVKEAKEERKKEAWELRITGKSYPAIADELGISTAMAFKYCKEVMNELVEDRKHTAEQLRALETSRLEKILETCLGGNRILKEGFILQKIETKDEDTNEVIDTYYEKIVNPEYEFDKTKSKYLMYTNVNSKLIEKAIKISERLSKLNGLDMPTKQLHGNDPDNPLPNSDSSGLLNIFKKMAGEEE